MMLSVAHLTSAHPRDDVRIFRKQCKSLSEMGYNVSLIVADGKGATVLNDINIIDIGKPSSRITRMIVAPWKMFFLIKNMKNINIFHLHDPELIPIGLALRAFGNKVVFDSHEDVSAQIKSKEYLNKNIANLISLVYSIFEYFSLRYFSLLVAATPEIGSKLRKISKSVVVVNNYPLLQLNTKKRKSDHIKNICYVGLISEVRGAIQLVQAMEYVDDGIHLLIAGKISKKLMNKLSKLSSWKRCTYLGEVDALAVQEIYNCSAIGLATYLEAPNHNKSQPNKIYEYMAAGLPIICSNFPKWNTLITEANSGITVDPSKPKLIAQAINTAFNLNSLQELGENGLAYVEQRSNWKSEKVKLIATYKELTQC